VKIPNLDVDARVKPKRIDIGKQGIEKVVSEFLAMLRVERSTAIQVIECGWPDPQLHGSYRRSFCLASAQSIGCSAPDSTRA
jgi:hypothetical protein